MTAGRLDEIEADCLAGQTVTSETCLEVIDELRRFWIVVAPVAAWAEARLAARKNEQGGRLPLGAVLDAVDDVKLTVMQARRLVETFDTGDEP